MQNNFKNQYQTPQIIELDVTQFTQGGVEQSSESNGGGLLLSSWSCIRLPA